MARFTWNLKLFRHFANLRRDPATARMAISAADALSRDLRFAAYHAWTARSLLRDALASIRRVEDPPGVAALWQILREAEPGRTEFPLREADFKASAHIVAFFRAAHAATDLLAPVVYWGLGLDKKLPKPISPSALRPSTVTDQMRQHSAHPRVSAAWKKLLDLPSYRYLKALTNTMKHRSLVKARFAVSAEEFKSDARHGLQVGRFVYDATYEPKWVDDYLDNELGPVGPGCRLDTLLEPVIRIGVVVERLDLPISEGHAREEPWPDSNRRVDGMRSRQYYTARRYN